MIEAHGLAKYYGNRAAISDVSFKIQAGEIVGLLGLNGAGKSTILKILGSFLTPSQGQATIDGISIEDYPEEIRKRIGFLPDNPPLYDEMSVADYLDYVARIKEIASPDILAHVEEALTKTNLQNVRDDFLGNLSHGFRQRVAIAQAIIHKPKVLLLDEPINGLDPIQIVEMRDLVRSLGREHTVILSSHILSEITKTCDRIFIIDQGKLVAEGNDQDLLKSVASKMIVTIEVDQGLDTLHQLFKHVSGVEQVSVIKTLHNTVCYRITTANDVRHELAKVVMSSSVKLLQMQREDSGLESIFMKIVKSKSH